MKTATCSAWLLLLCLLTAGGCDGRVVGHAGQNVTLPCRYNIKTHGKLYICWGRGSLPNSGCNDKLIATDGNKVTEEKSSRYQLLGNLDKGDVSLTILNATQGDSGRYGCRVEVSGWFNDEKRHIDLNIETAPEPTKITDSVTTTEQTPSNHTQDHMNSTEDWLTSGTHAVKDEEEDSSSHLPVLVCVLVAVVALVTVVGLVIIASRWKIFNKMLHIPQQSGSSVGFSSSESSLRLHSRSSAVENIYQIDGTNDYEACP